MDAAGNAFSFTQTQAEAADSTNCTVTVPDHPLTAKGLATPWVLGDGCTWANGGTEGVFIDATILAPNGQIQVYNPLVINQGTTPAVAPTPPTIARGSQVILSVGYNGGALALVGRGARQGNCLDAFGNSLIDQTPQCNAANFYRMANAEIARGTLKIPAAGTGKDGQACQTTRDFALIDQDQSDNAVASYLFDPATGKSAQATAANVAAMPNATVESKRQRQRPAGQVRGSGAGLHAVHGPQHHQPGRGERVAGAERAVRPGRTRRARSRCSRSTTRSCWSAGSSAWARPTCTGPRPTSRCWPRNTNLDRNAAQYCQDMINIATPRLKLDAQFENDTASPVPDLGNNLTNFLAARLSGSFDNLNCKNYGLTNPITLTTDDNGVATARDVQHHAAEGQREHGRREPAATTTMVPGTTTGGPTSCRARTGTCSTMLHGASA